MWVELTFWLSSYPDVLHAYTVSTTLTMALFCKKKGCKLNE